ncbi:MAG: hypothetical protein QUU85_10750, partial [Candidatus Eisenbacteria bacterium]|nr:hypothetical protein [Candidatus Eisenbacteria bacterium]
GDVYKRQVLVSGAVAVSVALLVARAVSLPVVGPGARPGMLTTGARGSVAPRTFAAFDGADHRSFQLGGAARVGFLGPVGGRPGAATAVSMPVRHPAAPSRFSPLLFGGIVEAQWASYLSGGNPWRPPRGRALGPWGMFRPA